MVLDATLLNIQPYKVRINGKVEQSREWSSSHLLHLGVIAIEKGAFGSPSTAVGQLHSLYKNLGILEADTTKQLKKKLSDQREIFLKAPR